MNSLTPKMFLGFAALFGLLSVGFGAFGSHGLEDHLSPERLETWDLASQYQMYHALALFAIGWLQHTFGGGLFAAAGWAFIAGTAVFSGSLYLLAITDLRWFGAITPFGGVTLIAGWLFCLAGIWYIS